jgi:hypothetical protein
MFKKLMIAGVVVLISGCAGTNKTVANLSCSGENWKELGSQAAKAHKPVRSFDAYIESCGSHLEAGARDGFMDGYARALVDICNYGYGYKLGSSNEPLPNICPLEIRENYQQGYLAGNRVYKERMHELKRITDDAEQRSMRRGNIGERGGVGSSGQSTPAADDSM